MEVHLEDIWYRSSFQMDQWMCNIPFIVFMISFVHPIDSNGESLKGHVGRAV